MSTQIIDSTVIDSMLKARGIKVPRKACCGRQSSPIKYSRYLKQLGYTGDVAIRVRGVVTEMVHI